MTKKSIAFNCSNHSRRPKSKNNLNRKICVNHHVLESVKIKEKRALKIPLSPKAEKSFRSPFFFVSIINTGFTKEKCGEIFANPVGVKSIFGIKNQRFLVDYSRASNNRTYSKSQRSQSIHMLSIQIDTKSLELVINHQINNIKLSFFASHMKRSFPLCTFNRCCTVIRHSKVA